MLLKKEELVARGTQRSVYKFPNDEQLLVKIVTEDTEDTKDTAEKNIQLKPKIGTREHLKHYLPLARYRHVFCEIECETKTQMRAMLKGVRSPIAPTRGVVSSDTTFGILVKQISQKDGSVGLTLHELVAQGKFDEKALAALNEFAQSFFTLGIVAGDVHAKNIVWGDFKGELVPFLVDGYGDRNFVPLKTYIPWFRKRKLHKCFTGIAKKIGCHWSRSEHVFKLKNT